MSHDLKLSWKRKSFLCWKLQSTVFYENEASNRDDFFMWERGGGGGGGEGWILSLFCHAIALKLHLDPFSKAVKVDDDLSSSNCDLRRSSEKWPMIIEQVFVRCSLNRWKVKESLGHWEYTIWKFLKKHKKSQESFILWISFSYSTRNASSNFIIYCCFSFSLSFFTVSSFFTWSVPWKESKIHTYYHTATPSSNSNDYNL